MSLWQLITAPAMRWLSKQSAPSEIPLSDYERIRHELRPCDVILVEGRSRVSEVIKLVTQSPWSHAALYVGRLHDVEDPSIRELLSEHIDDPNTQFVIESELGKGTIVTPLEEYKHDHVRICRPSNISFSDCQKMIHYAANKLGHEYDIRQIFDLARLLFPWTIMPRRWRSSIFQHNVGTPTKTVCSTMIAEAFGFVHFPIMPLVQKDGDEGKIKLYMRNPKLCVPRDFDYSPYFEIIKYPFVSLEHHQDYRLLPWVKESVQNIPEAVRMTPAESAESTQVENDQNSSLH